VREPANTRTAGIDTNLTT